MTLDRKQKLTIQIYCEKWIKQIKEADHKDFTYFRGHSELEYTMSKIVDALLLMERKDIGDYPAPRYSVGVGLTKDYRDRLNKGD